MRAFNTTVIFTVSVTGNKFHHPGGQTQFSPYLEIQSTRLSNQIVTKLGKCKEFSIEYTRDFTRNISLFTITMELLTPDQLSNMEAMEAFLSSKAEVNPGANPNGIPYQCTSLSVKSLAHEGRLPKFKNGEVAYTRDFFGVVNKVNCQFLIPGEFSESENLTKNSLVEFSTPEELKIDLTQSLKKMERSFLGMTNIIFTLQFNIGPGKPGPNERELIAFISKTLSFINGVCLNHETRHARTGPHEVIYKTEFAFQMLTTAFDEEELKSTLELFAKGFPTSGLFTISFNPASFSLLHSNFDGPQDFYVSRKPLCADYEYNNFSKIIRAKIQYQSQSGEIAPSISNKIARQCDGFMRLTQEKFEYVDPQIFKFKGAKISREERLMACSSGFFKRHQRPSEPWKTHPKSSETRYVLFSQKDGALAKDLKDTLSGEGFHVYAAETAKSKSPSVSVDLSK